MDKSMLDFYSNFILSSFSAVTATLGSSLSDGELSHDKITRFLETEMLSSRHLWRHVKPLIRSIAADDGVIVVDDTIIPKPHMDENDIICWHFDHASGRSVKGINLLSVLYQSQDVTLPVGYQVIHKTEHYTDPETGKEKRKSTTTKNEYFRSLLRACQRNNVPFSHVISDVWYASSDNMKFIKQKLHRDFVMPLKSNRKIALSRRDKRTGTFVTVETLKIKNDTVCTIYLEAVEFPLLLLKHVYTNNDGSTGVVYLVSSDTTLTNVQFIDLYHKRWKIECYHKALKQQCGIGRSPARTEVTQSSHLFCALCAFVKLELLHNFTSRSYEGLKLNLYLHALKTSFRYLKTLQPLTWAAKPIFA